MKGIGLFPMQMMSRAIVTASLLLFIIMLFSPAGRSFAGGQWFVNTSAQVTKGDYIFDGSTTAYYFYGGLRYQSDRWSVSLSLPLIAQRDDLVTYTGGIFLPTGGMHHTDNDMVDRFGGGMMGGHSEWNDEENMHGMSPFSNLNYGLGDLYLYSELLLLREQASLPSLSLNTQVKVPTANRSKNYGTGVYDYGLGLTVRKSMNSFLLFANVGFLVIGDPADVTFNDPVTFGLGFGKFFNQGRSSLVLYYQSYSEILPGYQPPSQISLGYYFHIFRTLTISTVALAGMSDTSPNVSFLSGLQVGL
ncbi:MAG: hypothetical protein GWP06_01960 [Actinobacteria bacterium]|nr:hypothetical protein [Actinomycetota bacterium]